MAAKSAMAGTQQWQELSNGRNSAMAAKKSKAGEAGTPSDFRSEVKTQTKCTPYIQLFLCPYRALCLYRGTREIVYKESQWQREHQSLRKYSLS